jgi:hypothetical protein
MRTFLVSILVLVLAGYSPARAQQSPAQQDVTTTIFGLGAQMGATVTSLEAQKTTLIEWLKAAQRERDEARGAK